MLPTKHLAAGLSALTLLGCQLRTSPGGADQAAPAGPDTPGTQALANLTEEFKDRIVSG